MDGTGEQSLVLANGAWVPADPANLPAGNPSGTWNSLNGATHDGDSSTSAQSVAVPGGRQFDVRIGTIFSVGRSLGTLTVPLLPRTGSECIRQVADYDDNDHFLSYSCVDTTGVTSNFESASGGAYPSPLSDKVYLAINRTLFTYLGTSAWVPCSGAQLKDGHWSCEQRTGTFSTSSSRSDIYAFPWAGGSSTLLGSIPGQSVAWLGVAEDGGQLVVAGGSLTSTGAITGCSVSWRNPVTLAPLSQAIPNDIACQGGRGSGGIAPSIQVVQQGLLDN